MKNKKAFIDFAVEEYKKKRKPLKYLSAFKVIAEDVFDKKTNASNSKRSI